jgi:hypothetical protein
VELTGNQLALESTQIELFLASVAKIAWRSYAGAGLAKKERMKAQDVLQGMIGSIRGLGDIWMHSEESQNETEIIFQLRGSKTL